VVGVEAAHQVLVGFAAAGMLGRQQPGDGAERLGGRFNDLEGEFILAKGAAGGCGPGRHAGDFHLVSGDPVGSRQVDPRVEFVLLADIKQLLYRLEACGSNHEQPPAGSGGHQLELPFLVAGGHGRRSARSRLRGPVGRRDPELRPRSPPRRPEPRPPTPCPALVARIS